MAIQPRWNKMETAILLEAVLNVEKGTETRRNAIMRVSDTLRKIARVQGIEVDEKYRNVNGITFQFQSMEYSALGRVGSANKKGSKLFDEIVVLKKQFPAEYDELLEQAKKLLKMNETDSGREDISENEFALTETDKKLQVKFPNEIKQIYLVLKMNSGSGYLTAEQIASLAKCEKETAEFILVSATWSEKLGNGFALGRNVKYHEKNLIAFSIVQSYDLNTNEDEILMKHFRRGFSPRSIMDRKRFINLYKEQFGETISDDEAVSRITARTFAFDERLFLPKAVVSRNTAESLREYVENYFMKKEILFYDVLFHAYKEQLNSLIYSSEMLAAFIEHTFIGTPLFFRKKYFSYIQSAKPDISSEVIDYLIRADRPCSYDEIYDALPHLKREDIYSVLHYNTPEILGNSKTEYFHVKVAHINDREKSVLETYCERLLENNKYITCKELIEQLPQIDEKIYEKCEGRFTTLGLRRIFTYYLREKFDVMTGVITRKDEQMTIKDVFADYARKHPIFTIDDVQDLADYMGIDPYWNVIHDNAVRINSKDFVADDMVDFDIDAIDNAIAFYCEDYMPLAGIGDFMRFPSCGYPWNIYLLQEYVYRFSKAFKLLFLGFAKGRASGVIVKKQSEYSNFADVLVDALSKTDITVKQDAMNYLCEQGFISERRYKKVEEFLKKAVILRKKNSEK